MIYLFFDILKWSVIALSWLTTGILLVCLFFQERFYHCSSNMCHLLWVFYRLRALYFSRYRKLFYFQVNKKKTTCVRFLTILVFLLIQSHYNLICTYCITSRCICCLKLFNYFEFQLLQTNSTTPNQNETNDKIYVGVNFYYIWWLQKEPFFFFSSGLSWAGRILLCPLACSRSIHPGRLFASWTHQDRTEVCLWRFRSSPLTFSSPDSRIPR